MPTKNVNLSPQQVRFISRNVDRGRYRNASEVVRAGLRMLEQSEREEQLKLHALRRLARQAFAEIDRGEYVEVADARHLDDFMAKMDVRVRASGKR